MSLINLAKALKKKNADGSALINHIYTNTLLPASEAAYVKKYFNEDVRKAIFNGTTISGGLVNLSTAAANLKDAFQLHYSTTTQFPPFTAYHATKAPNIAASIAAGGFRPAGQTLYGAGTYFFHDRTNADNYAKQGAGGQVLAVTIFGDISVGQPNNLGADTVVLQTTPTRNIFLVKNALVIFPKAVYTPA